MKKIFYSSLILISLFSASCSLQDHVLPGEPDVYVSGYDRTDSTFSAIYWKNGQPVWLETSSTYVGANSIAVSGNDVYVVGHEADSSGTATGVYWKNGVRENFSKDISAAFLNDVEVVGNDVYVAGMGFQGSDYFAAYWKNGVSVKLSGNSGWARGITVVGNDVYAAGYTHNGTHQIATYWKNGVPVILSDGTHDAIANAISVSGNEVLVVGAEQIDGLQRSRYWKNGTELGITSNKVYSELFDITSSNNGIYMIGREIDFFGHILYWHNSLQSLDNGTYGSGIKVFDNDVYVSGGTYNGSTGIAKGVAKYWKNGQDFFLSDGITTDATTTSIFVKKP